MRPGRRLLPIICAAVLVMVMPAVRGPSEAGRFQAAQQALGQTTKTAPQAANDPAAGVEITAQALPASKFCAFGPKAYVVYVPLDVTIGNGRREPIILSRYLNTQRILLGKTSDDVTAKKYELATPVRAYRTFAETGMFGPQPSDDNFVILKHNQTYEYTTVQGVPVRNDPNDKVPGTVYPGTLAMSIEVQTWPFARDARSVQTQWAKYGELISTPVISYPTLIRLTPNPVTEKCGLVAP